MQTLLALTDLDQQVRVGALTVEQIQDKLKDTVKAEDVAEATTWLARSDVRLISPIERSQGRTAYELAHERIIPALMQFSGRELTEANRANKLLDTRVNEWLGSNFSSRYLLAPRELWLIERQKPYLIWGSKQRQKENLIKASKRHIQRIFGVIGWILLLIMGVWSWLNYTPSGQIWQIRRDLVYWSDQVEDDNYQAQAALAFAKDKNEAQASKLVEKIGAADTKAQALTAIAKILSQLKQEDKAANTLT